MISPDEDIHNADWLKRKGQVEKPAMSDPHLDPSQDPDRKPLSAAQVREEQLYEQYYRRFKTYPPMFDLRDAERPAFLKEVEEAIKTGVPITLDIPPGAVA